MKCKKCNYPIPEDSTFCQYCGNKIEDEKPSLPAEDVQKTSKSAATDIDTSKSADTTDATESYIDNMSFDDALRTIIEIQAQSTAQAIKASSKTQSHNEDSADFGLVPQKPIYTSAFMSVDGEKKYLNCLYTSTGEKITYNRRGSTFVNELDAVIDIYDTFLPSGQPYKTIYINMYGATTSNKAPLGFILINQSPQDLPLETKSKQVKTKACTSCEKKSGRLVFKVLSVFLVLFLLICGHFYANYLYAITAIDDKDYYKAKQHLDNLLISDRILPEEYTFVKGNIYYKKGEYVRALYEFTNMDSPPFAVISSLKSIIYNSGQTAYRNKEFSKAEYNFNAIKDYQRSSDYLLLISCSGNSVASRVNIDRNHIKLINMLDFENTREILLNGDNKYLLDGRWESKDVYPYYFELYESDSWHASYNLPVVPADGYFYLSKLIFSVGKAESVSTKYFKFEIIDKNTISVYCYADGSTHILYRTNKR